VRRALDEAEPVRLDEVPQLDVDDQPAVDEGPSTT
jgi:hypothetical protein